MKLVKRNETIYEIIETPRGTHINIYEDEVWQRKIFIPLSEYRH